MEVSYGLRYLKLTFVEFSDYRREPQEWFNVGMREEGTVIMFNKVNSICFLCETKISRCCILFIYVL